MQYTLTSLAVTKIDIKLHIKELYLGEYSDVLDDISTCQTEKHNKKKKAIGE